MNIKDVGRLTLSMFMRLYQHYKDTFDLELYLKSSNMTYKELNIKQEKSEEWL